MLQRLNERIQGFVAWIVIILVAITFTLFGIDYYMQSHQDSSVQAEVNGVPITKQAYELNYRRTRQSRQSSQLTAASENQLKQQILNEMILNSVSTQSARINGFEVSSNQANAAIVNIPQFQEDGHFSNDRYAQALNGAFFTAESFQNEVRQGMLLNQQRFALIGTSFAMPADIERFVKLYMQTRDYTYLQIPALRFFDKKSIAEDDITAYYKQHSKSFVEPEKVSIEYIRLSMQDIKNSIKINDTTIQRYYDENKLSIEKPFTLVKPEIKAQLLADKAQRIYAKKLEQLSDLSYQTPDTLVPVAKALRVAVEQSEDFSRHGGEKGLIANKPIVRAAFSHDVLVLGNNSEPIQVDTDTVVVLRVIKHVSASERMLVDVKYLIAEKLARKKAQAEAMQMGKLMLDTEQTTLNVEDLVKQNKLQWKDIKNASRDVDSVSPVINELAFSLPRVGEKAGQSLVDGDYVIVSLNAINNGVLATLDKEQVSSITQQIEANYGVMDYELYINGLMGNAKIVRH